MRSRLRPFEYMAWAKTEPTGAGIDLCASGMSDFADETQFDDPELAALFERPIDPREISRRSAQSDILPRFCARVAARYGLDAGQVIPSFGASQSIMQACFALVRPGDHVIVERPTYEPMHRVPELLGANVSRLERTFDESWAVLPERLAKLLTPRTSAVILSNLHNPSGVAISDAALREIAEMANRVGALVLVDEVYMDYAFDAEGEHPWRSAVLGIDNAVVWSSTTKAFGFGALRAGWILTRHPEALRDLRLGADYFAVDPPLAGFLQATRVLEAADALAARARKACDRGKARVAAWLAEETRVQWVEPDAGASCVLRLPKLMDVAAFCEHLRREHDTQVVPGRFFDAPNTVRLSFAGDPEQLARGLANISATLDALA